jgi:hypothetical protein
MYYIQYILSWIYHNVLYTDATLAIVRILIFIGLVSLLVYREYILFALLCIIVICAEWLIYTEDERNDVTQLFSFDTTMLLDKSPRTVDKDELTRGIPVKEGFSIGIPKIVQGDDSGKDHRRSNKFIEEDSNDFTDKYFNSKQCSIGSGIGGISMFGSNELLEGSTRTSKISGIYDFYGKVTSNDASGNAVKRYNYFKDCVYEPVYRSKMGSGDFRDIKKKMYNDINNQIINIKRCTSRFNTKILFDTSSDITADRSKRLSLSNMKPDGTSAAAADTLVYVSLVQGDDNAVKMKNIQPLNKGSNGDNVSENTYSALLNQINNDDALKNNNALKQRYLDVYSKVYGYRKRIDEILSIMREQTKNDASLLYTIRVSESLVQELRMILSYLSIIERTNDIIVFETTYPADLGNTKIGIYDGKLAITPLPTTLPVFGTSATTTKTNVAKIRGDNDIFKIPLDDDTYNTIDEKRYLYGISFYFA